MTPLFNLPEAIAQGLPIDIQSLDGSEAVLFSLPDREVVICGYLKYHQVKNSWDLMNAKGRLLIANVERHFLSTAYSSAVLLTLKPIALSTSHKHLFIQRLTHTH